MRLFTALEIPTVVQAALERLLRELSPAAPFRWSPPENLHITTKFIGDFPPPGFPALERALAGIGPIGAIDISVTGLAWFPNPHNPRVLFAGIRSGPALEELHRKTDAACAALGIPAETKPYRPHITLARIRNIDGLPEVRRRIAQGPSTDFGSFSQDRFHLYQSVPGPSGSLYTKLEEFSLL